MAPTEEPRDVGLAIIVLRSLPNPRWSQTELSRQSGVDKGLISDYELGRKKPGRKTRRRLAAAVGVDVSFFEQLIPFCRGIRLAFERALHLKQTAGTPEETGSSPGLEGKVARAVWEGMAPALLQLEQRDRGPAPSAEDRVWAEEKWSKMKPLADEDQSLTVEVLLGDQRSWALAEKLCLDSETAAADRASEALRLARLAVHLAEHCPGPENWCLRLRGWCEPFLANAWRVGGDLNAAEATFASADDLWEQGAGGDPAGLLDSTRRLDLKASLLMNQGYCEEAILLLDQALGSVSNELARGRLLLKKARAREISGEYESCLELLEQAEPRLVEQREPRMLFLHRFTLTNSLCHLDRYEAAEPLVPLVERLAAELGNELDRARARWLRGRIWAGLGREEEALATLSDVRRYLQAEEIAYDYALVSLEVAELLLKQGQTRLVRELAEEMLWIFKSQKVHKEALAALRLFCRAATQEKAQAGWTRRLIKYLYRAQHRPSLRFE